MLLQQVAGSLLKEFKDQFKGRKFTGMLEYITKQITYNIRDQNPIKMRNTDRLHLHDLEFYLNTLEWREFRLLRILVNRLQKNSKNKSLDPFDQWNNSLDIALELAKAHIDRELLNEFIQVIDSLDSIEYKGMSKEQILSLRPMLRSLCSLFALNTI